MIVVAGEALIDLVPEGEAGVLAARRPVPGGGPYNTAIALARLGTRTAFCSRVSTDAFGQALLQRLEAEGVGVELVQRGDEPTPLAVATIEATGSAEYGFYVQGTADRLFEYPGRLPADARALSVGTCSLVLDPGATAYAELMRAAAERGVFVALDPNIRPGLIPDAAAYRARFTSWLPHVSLLKLSAEDAQWLGGDIGGWLDAGPAAVVVTRGADGLSVTTRAGRVAAVPGVPVDVVDTIGAGDTANAALLHALAGRGLLRPGALASVTPDTWRSVLAFAARAAALTCTRPGAQPPHADAL
ncbi:carbohydrate kinase [Streptomyces sp. JJ66]|uniref:carbohydrate kinase family protein n=1 Tax=Streptomyces sp. JJ66 TaxID=2803843 RepID=UPI001C564A8E|nr:carbohydrate kinase [Streptomyces sp. JJ66]MBW1601956.1 carbohydrate kinase [Streptomyces sp. JJ66]